MGVPLMDPVRVPVPLPTLPIPPMPTAIDGAVARLVTRPMAKPEFLSESSVPPGTSSPPRPSAARRCGGAEVLDAGARAKVSVKSSPCASALTSSSCKSFCAWPFSPLPPKITTKTSFADDAPDIPSGRRSVKGSVEFRSGKRPTSDELLTASGRSQDEEDSGASRVDAG